MGNRKINLFGYNLVDIILILLGVATMVIFSVVFRSPWCVFVNTLLGLFCVFTQAKGKVSTQFIGIVYFVFYILISYKQELYGEAI